VGGGGGGAAQDLIFTVYELHHDEADYRAYVRHWPKFAALAAVFRRPNLRKWVLLSMQDVLYYVIHRPDLLRMLARNVSLLNDIYTETRNAYLSAATSTAVNKALILARIMRASMRAIILQDIRLREMDGIVKSEDQRKRAAAAAERLVAGSLLKPSFTAAEETAISALRAQFKEIAAAAAAGTYRWGAADAAVDIVGAGLHMLARCPDDLLQRRAAGGAAPAVEKGYRSPIRVVQDYLHKNMRGFYTMRS